MKSIENRNKAFASIAERMPLKRRQVYRVIKKLGRCSLDDIIKELNVNKNEVSGRITELKNTFYIKECDTIKKSTRSNNNVTVYECIYSNKDRKKHLKIRHEELYNETYYLAEDLENCNYDFTKKIIMKEFNKAIDKFNIIRKELKIL